MAAKGESKMKEESNSVNACARWKDSVKRELLAFNQHQNSEEGPRPYHLNPRHISSVTRKIGSLPVDVATDSAKEMREMLARSQKAPTEVLPRAATTSQEYGWYARQAVPEPFSSGLHRSGEVKFAIAYAKSFHVGPFGKTQPMAR